MGAAPLAHVVRSGVEESLHLGHVAVCDADGRLLASAGDPRRVVYLRSCAKPVQAAVSLDAIAEPIDRRLVAVMCSSHNGEPVHIRTVRRLLARAGLDPTALRTPLGRPLDPEAARRAREPSPLLHNCSGKHAGMLAACLARGWPIETYRRPSHPLQRRVTRVVRAATGVDVGIGVDGCGVPVHAAPLAAFATLFARLSAPERFGRLAGAVATVTDAMRAEPYLVGGRDRVDTTVMAATTSLLVKEGAEALTCAVDLERGIGVAVKVADGGERAVGPALVSALGQLDLVDPADRRLAAIASRPVLGGGAPVGVVEAVVRLDRNRRS